MAYRLFIPKNYQASTWYPLVISLHGAGERGNDNTAQLKHDVSKMWADDSIQTKHPSFVLAPQCPNDNKWVDVDWALGSYDQSKTPISDELQGVIAILDSLGREPGAPPPGIRPRSYLAFPHQNKKPPVLRFKRCRLNWLGVLGKKPPL